MRVCLVATFAGDLLLTLSIHRICERSESVIDPKSLISLFATAQPTKSAHDTSALGFVPISCARVAQGWIVIARIAMVDSWQSMNKK